MRLLLYAGYAAATGAAGVALALAAGQEPAEAHEPDGPITGTVTKLLDPLAGKRPAGRPTPVRDTLTSTTTIIDKTAGKATGAVKTVGDRLDKATKPLPVAGKTVNKLTDKTLNAVTKPRRSDRPVSDPDPDDSPTPAEPANPTGEPDQPVLAEPKPTLDTRSRVGGPQTAPEPERRSPTRHAGSGAHLPWQTPAATPANRTPAPAATPGHDAVGSGVRDQQQPPPGPCDNPDMGADSLVPTGPPTPPDGTTADTPTHPNLQQPSPADTSTQRRGRHHPPAAPSG